MKYSGFRLVAFLFLVTAISSAVADTGGPAQPTLIVTLVVDQYSADLFNEYRSMYRQGLARLASGVVFPAGYQSHAATETCPGHSTILTGARPSRTGVIANDWQQLDRPYRQDGKESFARYCADGIDSSGAKAVSADALLVPTLGDRLSAADSNSRTVSIAGKDRSAIMLGGKGAYLTLWWVRGKGFVTYPDAIVDAGMRRRIDRVNDDVKRSYDSTQQAKLPKQCAGRSQPIDVAPSVSVGELKPAAARTGRWRATPAFDALTAQMAIAAMDELRLGRRGAVDLLAISFSATDYVGHYFGTGGAEMCAQQLALDATIGRLLSHLDSTGVSYVVALTADHGGSDIPERNKVRGVPQAQRLDEDLLPQRVGESVARELRLPGKILLGREFGSDVYLDPSLDRLQRPSILDAVRRMYAQHAQVAQVFTRNELIAAELPSGPPDEWTLLERARASFHPQRSGDLVVLLKPHVTLYGKPKNPDTDYIGSHGSPWDYDRRVPILFWWRGIAAFEQPAAVETVDIAPTLGDLVGVKIDAHEIDGRVLSIGQPTSRSGDSTGSAAAEP